MNLCSTFDTTFTADSCEFLPSTEFGSILAVGTYQLVLVDGDGAASSSSSSSSPSQRKVGRLFLFDADVVPLHPLQTIDTAAILDMKWFASCCVRCGVNFLTARCAHRNHQRNKSTGCFELGVALANGDVDIYQFDSKQRRLERFATT